MHSQRWADLHSPRGLQKYLLFCGLGVVSMVVLTGMNIVQSTTALVSVEGSTRDPGREAVTRRQTFVNPVLPHCGIILQRFDPLQEKKKILMTTAL